MTPDDEALCERLVNSCYCSEGSIAHCSYCKAAARIRELSAEADRLRAALRDAPDSYLSGGVRFLAFAKAYERWYCDARAAALWEGK